MKKWFKNLTKGKLAIGVLALCLLVFGGYFGYHKLVVRASSSQNKAVVNTLAEYNAMCESGKVDPTQEAGDKDNPFLILEIVPYYGQAEIGYLISGCEPIDFTKVDASIYAKAEDKIRTVASTVFADEYRRDADDDGKVDETCWDDEKWEHNTTKTIKVKGYYERVADGKPGDFVIDHYEQDTTGTFYTKDADGKEIAAYRPVFRKAANGETGQFIWVTMVNATSQRTISDADFDGYAREENKYTSSADGTISYKAGDREYTTREDSDYYYIQTPSGEGGWDGDAFKGHVVNRNDFVRTSLGLEDKSEAAILNLKIAVKTIEPQELKNHPEWIDYADLMYIHQGCTNTYPEWWGKSDYVQYRRTKDELSESPYKAEVSQGDVNEPKFESKYDWGWNVAKKLFFKANQLGDYDG